MSYLRTYKFKLKPTNKQRQTLAQWLGSCRFVYNICLEYKKILYSQHQINISKYDMQKELKGIKNETPWLKTVHSQVIQDVTDRLFLSYDKFFKRGGFPKFTNKDKFKSFKFKQGVKITEKGIKLPKIGLVKYHKSQEISGPIKTASIIRECGNWYISLSCETEILAKEKNKNIIGIDLGIKDLAIDSNGRVFSNPKTLYKHEKKLKQLQKSLSRKTKGSNNRKKVKYKLQKKHKQIRDIRSDNLHQLTSKIINENQVIICEDLKPQNMVKNHKLAKSISDASWGRLTSMLEYKSRWYGRTFIKVPAHYTSQDCNECGWRNAELTLADREWVCQECGVLHDRDINAAINIKNKGIKELGLNFSTCRGLEISNMVAQ